MTRPADPSPEPAVEVLSLAPRLRRRLGFLLAVFGLVGLVLVGTAVVLVATPIDEAQGPFGIEGQRRQLVALLDASERALDSAEVAARDADRSLVSTAAAAGSAATLMDELSGTLRALAGSLRVSFFGSQPFAPAADDMDRVADRAGLVATDLDTAASSVRLAAEDLAVLARDLAGMRDELSRIRSTLTEPIEVGAWRLLLLATLAWLAIPAVVSLWLGLRWLRRPWPVPAPASPASREPVARRTD